MRSLIAAISGVVFAVGLTVSGMTRPGKVLAFLDFTGDWDPSLAFVMGGAVAVYAVIYRLAIAGVFPRYVAPALTFASASIDARLLIGSALFGVGWGMAGLCPGPALVSLGTFAVQPLVFGVGMVGGMLLFELVRRVLDRESPAPSASSRPAPEGRG